MEEKFTPGPWKYGSNPNMYTDLSGHGGKAVYHGTHHVGWANVENEDGDIVMDEAIANARLMAAAPEMLSLMRELIKDITTPGTSPYVLINWGTRIRQILAKVDEDGE